MKFLLITWQNIITQDADIHGNQKKVSASIGLLEHNTAQPARGAILLRYVACTNDNAHWMLGKAFYEDMKGIRYSLPRVKYSLNTFDLALEMY